MKSVTACARIAPSVLLAALLAAPLAAAPQAPDLPSGTHAGMLRTPDISQSHIVFAYDNDLWLVSREGGTAVPLVSPPGSEAYPRFSPDGSAIFFLGNYEGNADLYTIPVTGGVARRITYHPGTELPNEWLADGRLLFEVYGRAPLGGLSYLYTVPAGGGVPEKLPVPYGANATISPDGKWLAYTPYNRDNRTWKRYRGGMASDIWLFNLEDNSSRRVTEWEGTDSKPMWHGDTLYYVSDQGASHRRNIWKYSPRSGQRKQVTRFSDYDVKTPAIGPGVKGLGEIVFQVGGELRILDLATESSRAVAVMVPGDRSNLRPKMADASKQIQSWDLSPSGKRAVVQARGDVWTLPAKNGSPRNLTHTNGVSERLPSWSPDGRWICYFADADGDYELYVTQSDGKGETKRLTFDGGMFKTGIYWSPDSKHILFTDKSNVLRLHNLDAGETKEVVRDPFPFFGGLSAPSWSHDSRWVAYSRSTDDAPRSHVCLYEVETGTEHQVTRGMYSESTPAFDRKGDWLYYQSSRNFSPTYSSVDSTFVYGDAEVILAAPLRADLESPWAPESDEETWEEEDADDDSQADDSEDADNSEDADDAEDESGDDAAGDEEESGDQPPAADDGLSGTWEGTLHVDMEGFPPDGVPVTLNLTLHGDGSVTGDVSVPMGSGSIEGKFDKATGRLEAVISTDEGEEIPIECTVSGGSLKGTGTMQGAGIEFECERTAVAAAGQDDDDQDGKGKKGKKDEKAKEKVEIDLEGLERRAMALPVKSGNFGMMAVNDKNQLLYVRMPATGVQGSPSIKLFDLKDEKKAEKNVTSGSGGFAMSADGKKILVPKGRSASIMKAAAGGSGETVPTAGMNVRIDPMTEWKELFTDAWRIMRDYFYDPHMHGVDWDRIHSHYLGMIDDCASREDVQYVIGEMIAELNVGHAYLRSSGDAEEGPDSVNVGMLGCDFELDNGAFKIARIIEGGPWDSDARGPLSRPGIDVKEGDYLLAVNGVPVDTSMEPYAAFLDLAGKVVTLTVSEKPEMDDDAREVIVKCSGSESGLRFRNWIEANRAYVDEQTSGRVGYIYVPNTGIQGQNELFRQFYSQIDKEALIIDERWNGGGQIPNRFIELLNRPAMNYWAGRDGDRDWHWPPDSHQGPKCMLINGRAGSGGDLFPAYFKQVGLGKLIGTRTWGGLVGISGNPGVIDGGGITVPTFAYYQLDGTWGIEGHGVDPDIEVIDDPALMVDGGDPQLDAAIKHMLGELSRHPFRAPRRPEYPDRSGMGIRELDK